MADEIFGRGLTTGYSDPLSLKGKSVRVKRVALQNVRSFKERQELLLDGPMAIVIGPNGGGKTNLLDAAVIMLRRYLFAAKFAVHSPSPENPNRHEFRDNDVLNNMVLERHSQGGTLEQVVEVEVEVTARDVENMRAMQSDAARLTDLAKGKYENLNLLKAAVWDLRKLAVGTKLVYRVVNGGFQHIGVAEHEHFLDYLRTFEMDGKLREEFGMSTLTTPLVYLPVNRSASGFQSSVELSGFNDWETKRHSDAASSRSGNAIVARAVGRMAQKYRLLLEEDKGAAATKFYDDPSLQELSKLLAELGYEWRLESVNPLKNQYDVRLKKQGSSFLVGAASSGERELLTYLFAIFALNVRDALIIVDEPELHLHPKWQKTLLHLFIRLSETTGNQFLLATHSPTFVSPESIRYVSRVFSREQRSHILRLDMNNLPEPKHLLNIVNSQNNERLFFADSVVLVEGLSDRIFFEEVLNRLGRARSSQTIVEVVSVGGKGLFEAYTKILEASEIGFSIIADLDYIEQVGSPELKALFRLDRRAIKTDVIENIKSIDGDTLVAAIDDAVASGSWEHAKQIWEYIKARRRDLRADLREHEASKLRAFLQELRERRIIILRQGALEAYLPDGFKAKDLDKLIRFIDQPDFLSQLRGRDEIEQIGRDLLPASKEA